MFNRSAADTQAIVQLIIDAQSKQQGIINENIEKDLYKLDAIVDTLASTTIEMQGSLTAMSNKISTLVDGHRDLMHTVREVAGSAKIISHIDDRLSRCERDITEISNVVDELRRDYDSRCQLKEDRKSLFMTIFSALGSQGIGWIVAVIAGLSWVGYLSSKDFNNQQNPPVQLPDPHNTKP